MKPRHEIKELKRQKNAIILAHYYQVPEIQDIADYVGDSLGLSQEAAKTDAKIILFAGVLFMAETAKILNPTKKVLLPDTKAGCSLADSCTYDELKKFKELHPDHIVISYINCTANVKTLSDMIVTSSNAVKIVNSFSKDQKIIFAPDRNLGGYINRLTNRNMLLWDGSCQVHDILTVKNVLRLKILHPKAKVIAHPECRGQILAIADFIGSTTAMLDYTIKDNTNEYIVATESGILHQMQNANINKSFYSVTIDETCSCNDCPYMKLNTMEKLRDCLRDETPEITMEEDVMEKARIPLMRMLKIK